MKKNNGTRRLDACARLLIAALLIFITAATPLIARGEAESLMPDDEMATTENSLEILGEQRQLLKTFVNPDAALARFEEIYPEFLQNAEEAGLPELSEDTAYAYKVYAISTEADGDIIDFLDIYENDASNRERTIEIEAIEDECEAGNLTQ